MPTKDKESNTLLQLFYDFIKNYCEISENCYYSSRKLSDAYSKYIDINGIELSNIRLFSFYLSTKLKINQSKTSSRYLGIRLNQKGESLFFPYSINAKIIDKKIKKYDPRELCILLDCQPTIDKFHSYYEHFPQELKKYIDKNKIITLLKQIETNLFKLNTKRKKAIKIGLALKILSPLSASIIAKTLLKQNCEVSSIRALKNYFLQFNSFKEYLNKHEVKTIIRFKSKPPYYSVIKMNKFKNPINKMNEIPFKFTIIDRFLYYYDKTKWQHLFYPKTIIRLLKSIKNRFLHLYKTRVKDQALIGFALALTTPLSKYKIVNSILMGNISISSITRIEHLINKNKDWDLIIGLIEEVKENQPITLMREYINTLKRFKGFKGG
jgi:hypothetical protein